MCWEREDNIRGIETMENLGHFSMQLIYASRAHFGPITNTLFLFDDSMILYMPNLMAWWFR
jgi:hypothetical protein